MPTRVHELFLDGVEDAIRSELKAIREESDRIALFAQKVRPARSTEIQFPVEDPITSSKKSKHEPDASFWHMDAEYPGVVIEVAYSQKKRRLYRLAEKYLLDSDANIRVVVGLDIEYGEKGTRKAALSIWRPTVVQAPNGQELQVDPTGADKIFRDDQGNPVQGTELQLRLSDFASKSLVQEELGNLDKTLVITAKQLCICLSAAEAKSRREGAPRRDALPQGVQKRKREETPPDQITSSDDARYDMEVERAAKRMAHGDPDYT
ncbi:hypothetical protein SLS60_011917 [Paraconiothyrium brasiliense]|uniref:Restriction endonuclease domain-containing protein n=1 Tax=Paraconiothyrium brasiliense TaxID=300254 RepID=A0ABR3QH91_9PLEO